jgi:hypothetical protein
MNHSEDIIGPLEPQAVEALRAASRAPGGEGYWETLHAAIMTRVAAAETQAWWMVLSRWTKPALAAAAVVMLVATAAMIALGAREPEPVAYADVLEAQSPVPVQTADLTPPRVARDATFQFVMSSNGGRAP